MFSLDLRWSSPTTVVNGTSDSSLKPPLSVDGPQGLSGMTSLPQAVFLGAQDAFSTGAQSLYWNLPQLQRLR